jgi:lysophospholipase L1-like esterase
LFFAEIFLRYYYFGKLSIANKTTGLRFIQYDPQLGWSPIPDSEGYFINTRQGHNAYVKYDDKGIRVNDNTVTGQGESILIIGDSVTAGLEVDNNETYSAVLERLFSQNGCNYRVFNAGVLGYGTDQALWNMERLMDIVEPEFVIYMYASNDFLNNRTIKQPNAIFGKPVFVLNNEELILINKPAQKFNKSYYAYVEYDSAGYRINQGHLNGTVGSLWMFVKENLALFYPLKSLNNYLRISPASRIESKVIEQDYDILELILKKMKRDGIKLYFTSFPYEGEDAYIDNFIKISDKLGITYLNLFPYFTEEWKNYHWNNDRHWNEKGHLQAAKALYDLLKPQLCAH